MSWQLIDKWHQQVTMRSTNICQVVTLPLNACCESAYSTRAESFLLQRILTRRTMPQAPAYDNENPEHHRDMLIKSQKQSVCAKICITRKYVPLLSICTFHVSQTQTPEAVSMKQTIQNSGRVNHLLAINTTQQVFHSVTELRSFYI